MSDLTLDERAIAKLLAEGYTPLELSERLGISRWAVYQRIHYAGRKLPGRGSVTIRLVRWWCLVGLVEEAARLRALESAA